MAKLLVVFLLSLILSSGVSASERYKYDGPKQRIHFWDIMMNNPYALDDPPKVPTPVTCECSEMLEVRTLSGENGCQLPKSPNPCVNDTQYCDSTFLSTTICPGTCADPNFVGGDVEACGGANVLCLEVTCPRGGTITLKADSPVNTEQLDGLDCCGATNFLFVYKGTYAAGDALVVDNQQKVDYTDNCQVGQTYQICEKIGYIITSSVQARIVSQSLGECPGGTDTISCSP